MPSYRTPAAPLVFEIPKIKGSRFLADVAPVVDVRSALARLAAVRRQHHAARHHCWAYRLGEDGAVFRASDDGEPSGSGGRPILAAIEGADLTHLCVVVTRYFGGTKLGVGGLARAYGGAAAEVLRRIEVCTVVPTRDVRVIVPYEQLGVLEAFCAREQLRRPEGVYGEQVCFVFPVPSEQAEGFVARLVDASAGRITVDLAC